MKKLLLACIISFALACPGTAQNVKTVWLGNPNSDNVIGYEVQMHQTYDTTAVIAMFDTVCVDVPHIGEGLEHECGPYNFYSGYVIARVRARNLNGYGPWSDFTDWHAQGEFSLPGQVMFSAPAIRRY